jgi:predicted nucleotidyltransferase
MAKVDLFPDFRALLELLNSAGVRYLVLGGYAVNHYGHRRSTRDLDIWIATDSENASKVSRVLLEFGDFAVSQVKPSKFQKKGNLFIFGREPVRVDILTEATAIEFESSYVRRHVVVWDGLSVPLISFEDLKINKRGSGRAKDIADLENLPKKAPTRAKRKKSTRRRGPRL